MIFQYHLRVVEAGANAAGITFEQAAVFLEAMNRELIALDKDNTGNQSVIAKFAQVARKLAT